MYTQNAKANMMNNILLSMSIYLNRATLDIMQQVVADELVKVNVQEIGTEVAVLDTPAEEQNEYCLKLFAIKKKNLQPKTLEQYVGAIRRLCAQVNKPLSQMDDIDIDYYLRHYENRNKFTTGKKNKPSTINNERRFLSAFFTWMRKAKLRQDNPVENTEMYKTSRDPIDYYTDKEMEQIREGCRTTRDRALVEVFRSTGCRVGEIVSINRADVNWSTGDIVVLGEKGGGYRTVYLDEAARHYLQKYLEDGRLGGEALFVGCKAPFSRLQPAGIRIIFKEIGRRSNMTCRVYPHKFRKTLGMTLKKKGVDIGVIQEVLGHQDPSTTSRYYAESTVETLRDVRRRVA